MKRNVIRQVFLACEEVATAKAVSLIDARHARKRDKLAMRAFGDALHHVGPWSLETRGHHEDLKALANKRGKAVNGNRHDLPRSTV